MKHPPTRRTHSWAVLATLALPWACVQPPPPEADLKPLVAAMTERGWNRGEVEVFDSLMADRVTFHYAGTPREMAREDMAGAVLGWREGFSDLEMATEEMIQEGDLVAARFTLSGTNDGPWRGQPPTGRRATMALTMFFRFEDGRVVELWESDDQAGFRDQLGLD